MEEQEEDQKSFNDAFKYKLQQFIEIRGFTVKQLQSLESTLEIILDRRLAAFKTEIEAGHNAVRTTQGMRIGEVEAKVNAVDIKAEVAKAEVKNASTSIASDVENKLFKLKSDLQAEIKEVIFKTSLEDADFKNKFKFVQTMANFIIPAILTIITGIILYFMTKPSK